MKVDLFDFDLPEDLIADRPAVPRDAARLMVLPADGPPADRVVRDLPDLLRRGDLLVFNDTRVIPARLYGVRIRSGIEAKVEIMLHRAKGGGIWEAFARPARKLARGDLVRFGESFSAEVLERGEGGEVTLRLLAADADFPSALQRYGNIPLPPYILSKRAADEQDREDYQTMFATRTGAVAAPTAGLHFTPELLRRLEAAGIANAPVTLHVSAGTFLPVSAEDTADHRMHAEWGEISPATAEAANRTRQQGGRVVAVGTTSLRLLESAASGDGTVAPFRGETQIFITPGYRFRAVDLLLTNFHLPRSTLFMLVAAFAGHARIREAYAHAIRSRYRFYSYGDANLLYRAAA